MHVLVSNKPILAVKDQFVNVFNLKETNTDKVTHICLVANLNVADDKLLDSWLLFTSRKQSIVSDKTDLSRSGRLVILFLQKFVCVFVQRSVPKCHVTSDLNINLIVLYNHSFIKIFNKTLRFQFYLNYILSFFRKHCNYNYADIWNE